MQRTPKLVGIMLVVVAIFLAGCATYEQSQQTTPGAKTQTTPTQIKGIDVPLKIGTLDPGSYTYKASALFSEVWTKEGFNVEIYPYSNAASALRAMGRGEVDMSCHGTPDFEMMYAKEGVWKDWNPTYWPIHTLYFGSVNGFFVVPKDKADQYKCWSDLKGKKAFLAPTGYTANMVGRRVVETLGLNIEHVEVAPSKVADALRQGTIDAVWMYISLKYSASTWVKQLDLGADLAVVPMCPEERAKLEEAGFLIEEIDTSVPLERNDFGTVISVGYVYGFAASKTVPEDVVYGLLKSLEKHKDELATAEPGMRELQERFVELQVAGIKDVPNVPVHPGLAKYLKEKGVWEDDWKIAQ